MQNNAAGQNHDFVSGLVFAKCLKNKTTLDIYNRWET